MLLVKRCKINSPYMTLICFFKFSSWRNSETSEIEGWWKVTQRSAQNGWIVLAHWAKKGDKCQCINGPRGMYNKVFWTYLFVKNLYFEFIFRFESHNPHNLFFPRFCVFWLILFRFLVHIIHYFVLVVLWSTFSSIKKW